MTYAALSGTPAMAVAITLFIATYVLLLTFPKRRAYIALASAVLFLATTVLPIGELPAVILDNLNLLMMLFGIMGTVVLFIDSKMPSVIGDALISKMSSYRWAILTIALFSGLISAFIDNVATVLIMAPVAIDISKKAGASPVPAVLSVALMSNLQGAATLVGDTTSILLGAEADMNFFDFFVFKGKPGLFFTVQLAMIAALLVLLVVFRKENKRIESVTRQKPEYVFPAVILLLTVLFLIAASFLPREHAVVDYASGIICVAMFLLALAIQFVKSKKKAAAEERSGAADRTEAGRAGESSVAAAGAAEKLDASAGAVAEALGTAKASGAESAKKDVRYSKTYSNTHDPLKPPANKEAAVPGKKRSTGVLSTLMGIDFQTLLLLLSLFVIIGGVAYTGIIDKIAEAFAKLRDPFLIYTLVVFVSVILSAFIDNIPYVAAMLPVMKSLAGILNIEPYLMYFGLISGATLGGNLLPIGASANIAGLGILRKEGYEVSIKQFCKISVPLTVAAVAVGYIMIFLLWR